MSYCVNCGVELSLSEKSCPLCGVQVVNPADPWKAPPKMPYPPNVDGEIKHINKKFGALLIFILMLIPILVSCLCNLMIDGKLTWSLIVTGAVLCAETFILPPIAIKSRSPYLFLLLDFGAVILYLFLISLLTNGLDWYLFLAFPITDAVFISVFYIAYIARSKSATLPLKISGFLLVIGCECMVIDCMINFYLHTRISLFWSLIVAVVCALFSILFFILHRRRELLEEIKKRHFI